MNVNPLTPNWTIRLAVADDVDRVAAMSREYIEHGLGWSWTPGRVLAGMRAADMNLAVACHGADVLGFGLMRYKDEDAHLSLLAVAAGWRRRGVASGLVRWLEACALTAGIGVVNLEARVSNQEALTFYERLGYRPVGRVTGYYQGREDALRLARDLRAVMPAGL